MSVISMNGTNSRDCDNIRLLHNSAEVAKKDAKLWASRSEGDEGKEFEGADESLPPGAVWRPTNADMRYTFHDAIHGLQNGCGITKNSPVLEGTTASP